MGQTQQATRDRVLSLLVEHPGLHVREAPRQLGISLRASRYHLEALVEEGRAIRHPAGGFVRYFPAGSYDRAERTAIAAMRVGNQRALITSLIRAGPQTFSGILERTGLARSTVAMALRRLEEQGIVARGAEGKWCLADPSRCRMVASLFRPRLSDRLADAADGFFDTVG